MVQGVLHFVVTSVAAAVNVFLSASGTLVVEWARGRAVLAQCLLSSVLLSLLSLFWLAGMSRLLVHFFSEGNLMNALPFVLFVSPGVVYPWWMAVQSARYSGPEGGGCARVEPLRK